MVSATVEVCVTEPPEALTSTLLVPAARSDRVEIVMLVLTGVVDGVTAAGLKVQVRPIGPAGQLKLIGELNAFTGVTVTAIGLVVCPATTLTLAGIADKLKSG